MGERSVLTLLSAASTTAAGRSLPVNAATNATVRSSSAASFSAVVVTTSQASP